MHDSLPTGIDITMKNILIAMILLSLSCAHASAGTQSIGIVSVRGDMRIDGYSVWSNGTLFDGTAVETGRATATLQLVNGTEIKLATDSRGVVYSDHLVLLHGTSEIKASGSHFQLEAYGLSVAPNAPNTLGTVSLRPANMVEVAAVTGELRVTQNADLAVAHVVTGSAMLFQPVQQAAAPEGSTFLNAVEGLVSSTDGIFFLTTVSGARYQLVTGKELRKFSNKKVVVSGFLQASAAASEPTQLLVTEIDVNGAGTGGSKKVLIGIAVAGGGAAAAIGIAESSKSSASR